jgi:hypothetical protein
LEILKSFLEMIEDEKELHKLYSMIDHCTQGKTIPTENKVVNQLLCKERTTREFRFNAQIGEYDIYNAILDLGSDEHDTQAYMEMMGKPKLVWSPSQLRLVNQYKIVPIGRLNGIHVNIDGVRNITYFEVIEIVDGNYPYPTLMGLEWALDNQVIIHSKR